MNDEHMCVLTIDEALTEAELDQVVGGGDGPSAAPEPDGGKATPILMKASPQLFLA
jgi:hypothetical protein